jgi:pimeloyl-ACP methyl ester carboxylesterase
LSPGARNSPRFPIRWSISAAAQVARLPFTRSSGPHAPDRDLILVDQRSAGRSEPKLCPDLDSALFDAAVAVATIPGDDVLAKRRAAYAACRFEAIAHGIDLTDFGTSVTVADFEWVRRALRIERWNVYGESYGMTVAVLSSRYTRSCVC